MKTNNIILLGIIAVILCGLLIIGATTLTDNQTNNTTNDSVNITLNDTNNTTDNQTTQTQTQTKKKSKSSSSKKSDEPSVVSDSVDYNYQVDDGSYIRTVEYSNGKIKQYDMEGNAISPGDMS